MRPFIMALTVWMLVYVPSYTGHSWRGEKKPAAIGSALLALTAFVLMTYALFPNRFEL